MLTFIQTCATILFPKNARSNIIVPTPRNQRPEAGSTAAGSRAGLGPVNWLAVGAARRGRLRVERAAASGHRVEKSESNATVQKPYDNPHWQGPLKELTNVI